MYYDPWGRGFETKEEAKKFITNDLLSDEKNYCECMSEYFGYAYVDNTTSIINWIAEQGLLPRFKESFKTQIEEFEKNEINDRLADLEWEDD